MLPMASINPGRWSPPSRKRATAKKKTAIVTSVRREVGGRSSGLTTAQAWNRTSAAMMNSPTYSGKKSSLLPA